MFKLAKTLARNVSVGLDDTLRTKRAHNRLGYLQTPPYGITRYPNGDSFCSRYRFAA